MEEVSHKPYAETQAEYDMRELITLNSWVMEKVYRNIRVEGSEEYEELRQLYYNCVQNLGEVIDISEDDYTLPSDEKKMVGKIIEFINRVYGYGFYKIGQRKVELLPIDFDN